MTAVTSYELESLTSSFSSIFHNDGFAGGDVHFNILDSGKIEFAVSGNTIQDVTSTYAFNAGDFGQWFHIAVTYNKPAKTCIIYIDGQEDHTENLLTAVDTDLGPAQIGDYAGGSRPSDGRMDDFRIYSRELSSTEIADIYDATKL